MSFRTAFTRLRALVLRRARAGDEALRDELDFHREMLERDLRAQGYSAREARREARRRIGGESQVRDACADQRSIPALESILQDTGYALRTLRRAPAFTVAALLTLILGIGATTAIFTVVNAALLRPLPLRDAGELVMLGDASPGDSTRQLGYLTFADLRERTRALRALAAIRSWQPTLVTTEAERLAGMRVSWNYFSLLGVDPALGRAFRAEDDHPDRYRVVLLSDGLWRRRFNADPAVVGRTITMNDLVYEIVGVLPPDFHDVVSAQAYRPAEIWAPLGYSGAQPQACRSCRHLRAIGRLGQETNLEAASQELNSIRAALARQFPDEYTAQGRVGLTKLQEAVSGPVKEPLYVLIAAVGFVLLVACANVANLLLARAMGRSREFAVRAALGAGRRRLVRQLVTESLLLWSVGGTAGLLVAGILVEWLLSVAPSGLPLPSSVGIDRFVLLFCAATSLTTGVLFGLIPAVSATSARGGHAIAPGSRGAIGASSRRARQALIVVDLAVALVLLVGAGLMLKTVSQLVNEDPGFNTHGVVTAQFSLVGNAYRDDAAVYRFIQRVEAGVRALPGVEAAAVAGQIPMGGTGDRLVMHIDGLRAANPVNAPAPERYSVTPGYFSAMQIRLVRGRLFDDRDTTASEGVVIVSETAAKTLFAGTDPIGRRVRVGGGPDAPWRTIVGIVGDVRHTRLTETAWPQMYLPQSQFTDSFLVVVVKAAPERLPHLVAPIRDVIRQLDASVPLYDVALLGDLLQKSFAEKRFLMVLLVSFAAVSLLLASVGLYGVVSCTVSERTREVGVRVALGARPRDILLLVLRSGARTAAAGLAAGVAASLMLTRFLQRQLFEVSPFDGMALVAAVSVLTVVAAAAHLVPMRRALAVEPTVALRED